MLAVLEAGDNVVVTSRKPEALASLRAEHPDQLEAVALDVTSASQSRGVVAAAVERFGSVGVVGNNAGYATSGSIEDFPEDEFRAQVDTNLYGVVNMTWAVLPVMRRQRSGHIVQISSVGGRVGGTPGLSAYQTAKFAVEGFSEALANEVAPFGVKVTIVEPGGIRTGWATGAAEPSGPVTPDYEETVGLWLARFADYAGNEPGDPDRMARAIIGAVDAEEPPAPATARQRRPGDRDQLGGRPSRRGPQVGRGQPCRGLPHHLTALCGRDRSKHRIRRCRPRRPPRAVPPVRPYPDL
ncbi:SDR family NAD(P)-dependent oxidoreductase [Streptomyces griseoincarnatus]